MNWVCEAIDDERRFDDIFDETSFQLLPEPPQTRSKRKAKELDDDDADYSPKSARKSRKPKSLRAEVLSRSIRYHPY